MAEYFNEAEVREQNRFPVWYDGPGIYEILELDKRVIPNHITVSYNRKAAIYLYGFDLIASCRQWHGARMSAEYITKAMKLPDTPSEFLLDEGDSVEGQNFVSVGMWDVIIENLYNYFLNDQSKMLAINNWMIAHETDNIIIRNEMRDCRDKVALTHDPKLAFMRQLANAHRKVGAEPQWRKDKLKLPNKMLRRQYDRFVTRNNFSAR